MSDETKANVIKSEILSNYAKANIYIRTLDVQSIVESAKYTVRMDADMTRQILLFDLDQNIITSQADGFASGIGGALSLYLGVAIVMIFELIELLGDLIVDGISGDEEVSKRKAEKNNRVV